MGAQRIQSFLSHPYNRTRLAYIHIYIFITRSRINNPGRKKELEKKSGEKTKKNLKIRLKGGKKKGKKKILTG